MPAMAVRSARKRAWRLLRLAALWARHRGSAAHGLRQRLLETMRRGGGGRSDRLRYGEREYSIQETPAFRFRTPSARLLRFIPCIAPATPGTGVYYGDDAYFFSGGARDRDAAGCAAGYCYYYDDGEPRECGVDGEDELLDRAVVEEDGSGDDAGVDMKAEEFIARFHAQMKLQRQISLLQYNEMMHRSLC